MKQLICGLLLAGLAGLAAAADDIAIPGEQFFPQGIAIANDGSMFVGSIKQGAIYRVAPGSRQAEPFIAAGSNGLVSVAGLNVDERAQILWACSSDPGVGTLSGKAPVALKSFDSKSGRPKASYELPEGAYCNDMAIGRDGTVYVTDSQHGAILRLRRNDTQLQPWAQDPRWNEEGFSVSGITVDGMGALMVVTGVTGRLYRIPVRWDGAAGKVQEILLDRPLKLADGLRTQAKRKLLVVEGEGRLSSIDWMGENGTVKTVQDGLARPTALDIRNDTAYVVEGQLDLLFDKRKAGQPARPFRIVAVPLPK
ncbi:hypothetical protein ABWL39_14405 [Chitinivorax sp. PXF-14]|uniref:SMP-30/gluconolactonase/LRE family protein n=1 Tax=Chitinivorax sp. PXF-14 TaxID=3230488 RepID=UPI0034673262